jgi:hypothetical protein
VLEHYSTVAGRQVDDIDYYVVLAKWKLAIVLEQTYARAQGTPLGDSFGPIILDLMASAAEVARSSDYRG